jgi:hypothetical protein
MSSWYAQSLISTDTSVPTLSLQRNPDIRLWLPSHDGTKVSLYDMQLEPDYYASSSATAFFKEIKDLPASVSIPGVDACLYMGFGGVMRVSRGEAICCGVLIALCIGRVPFAIWA